MAGSTSRFKPAEEQFIEQTPWANPQHPSHAHLLQRQASAQQAPRTTSPFAQAALIRRHSDQQGPASGTFSSQGVNGPSFSAQVPGRVSPQGIGSNLSQPQLTTSTLPDNRQTSQSPLMTRTKVDENAKINGGLVSSPLPGTSLVDKHREFPQVSKREQAAKSTSHF